MTDIQFKFNVGVIRVAFHAARNTKDSENLKGDFTLHDVMKAERKQNLKH